MERHGELLGETKLRLRREAVGDLDRRLRLDELALGNLRVVVRIVLHLGVGNGLGLAHLSTLRRRLRVEIHAEVLDEDARVRRAVEDITQA